MSDAPRPRFGKIIHADGSETPIYYHPFEGEENSFIALDPKTDEPARLFPGDTIHFDMLGSDQTIMVERPNGAPRRGKTQQGWDKEKEERMNQKDPNGWWKGLVTLFVLGGFVLGMVWAIDKIIGG